MSTTSEQGRRRKRQRDEEGAGKGEEAAPEVPQSPLFAEVSSDWSHVDVYRVEPLEEQGFLGRVDLNATESDLRGRFGGGKYALRARDAQNRVRGNASVTIAGDPVFLSKSAATRWRRGLGQAVTDDDSGASPSVAVAPAAPAPSPNPFGIGEILTLFQSMQAQQMAAMQLMQQQQQQERQRRDEDDRRREDERRREERDRDERRQKDLDLQRERDRDHMQTLLTLATAGNKGAGAGEGKILEAFTTGMTTAMKLREEGGGGERADQDDEEEGEGGGDMTASTVTAAVRGLVDAAVTRFGGAASPSSPSLPPPGLPPVSPDDVHLTGPLAEKAKRLVAAAQKAKRDPEEVMSKGLDVMASRLELAAQNTEEKRNGAAKREAAAAAAAAANPGPGSSSPPAPPTAS